MRLWTRICCSVAVCFAAVLVLTPNAQVYKWIDTAKTALSNVRLEGAHPPVDTAPTNSTASKQRSFTVMAVGGSSAQGYDDPKLNGYLNRALSRVSATLNISLSFVNKAKSGDIPTMLASQYDPLLHSIHPNIVIISWGLLNDIAKKVPKSIFQRVIQSEVSMAITYGADVWLVTPPVTPASYVGHDVELEREYAGLEISGARAVHSTHVHVFDLMNAMKKYLKDHQQSYKPYSSNNWHMNQAGHVLAGQILADAIVQRAKSMGLT